MEIRILRYYCAKSDSHVSHGSLAPQQEDSDSLVVTVWTREKNLGLKTDVYIWTFKSTGTAWDKAFNLKLEF